MTDTVFRLCQISLLRSCLVRCIDTGRSRCCSTASETPRSDGSLPVCPTFYVINTMTDAGRGRCCSTASSLIRWQLPVCPDLHNSNKPVFAAVSDSKQPRWRISVSYGHPSLLCKFHTMTAEHPLIRRLHRGVVVRRGVSSGLPCVSSV
jgi:hypothetical protein